MRFGKSVNTASRAVIAAAWVALLLPGSSVLAQGGGAVNVMVCPQPHESSFVVATPPSDSTVDEPKLSLAGSVVYISQIDFFIDDVYNHTQALGYGSSDFVSTLTLAPGTHTLKLVASDSCSQTTHEQVLIITYQPKVVASNGGAVVTELDNGETVVIPGDPLPPASVDIFQEYMASPFLEAAEFLDLTNPEDNFPTYSPISNAGRAALFVVGTAVTTAGVYLGTVAALPAQAAFIQPFRREFLIGSIVAGLAMFGVVFTV